MPEKTQEQKDREELEEYRITNLVQNPPRFNLYLVEKLEVLSQEVEKIKAGINQIGLLVSKEEANEPKAKEPIQEDIQDESELLPPKLKIPEEAKGFRRSYKNPYPPANDEDDDDYEDEEEEPAQSIPKRRV